MFSRRKRAGALGLAGIVVVLAACDPTITPIDPSLGAKWLTHDQQTVYGITIDDEVTTVRKSSSTGDGRLVFWRMADPVIEDQQSCSTVTAHEQDRQQPGVALRIAGGGPEGTVKAITVTRAVWLDDYARFNVHLMDSSRSDVPPGKTGDPIGTAWLTSLLLDPNGPANQVKPYPWRICARAVGETITFKAWPTAEPEPAWDAPGYSGSTTVSSVWAGWPGWYAGHLEDGPTGWIDHSDQEITDLTP